MELTCLTCRSYLQILTMLYLQNTLCVCMYFKIWFRQFIFNNNVIGQWWQTYVYESAITLRFSCFSFWPLKAFNWLLSTVEYLFYSYIVSPHLTTKLGLATWPLNEVITNWNHAVLILLLQSVLHSFLCSTELWRAQSYFFSTVVTANGHCIRRLLNKDYLYWIDYRWIPNWVTLNIHKFLSCSFPVSFFGKEDYDAIKLVS